MRQVLEGTQSLEFRQAEDDQGRYAWIESVLQRFDYPDTKQALRSAPASFAIDVMRKVSVSNRRIREVLTKLSPTGT